MKLLLDTHILIWAMGEPVRLGPALRDLLEDPQHTLCFSVASLWELVIKASLGREAFQVQPSLLRRTLLDGGFTELPIQASHVLAGARLPPLHRDPFDRLLLAQAESEGLLLITADALVARYPGAVRHQTSF
ncbi:MAG: type II toxin-antitoxin system VapC family toxin [Cyanobium sp.]